MITDSRRLLEFDKILARIARFAFSASAAELIAATGPLADQGAIELRFARIAEIRALGRLGIRLPLAPFDDIRPLVELARPEGAVLNPDELALFIPLLRIARGVEQQFSFRTDLPYLKLMAAAINGFPDILDPLEQTIGPDGGLLDTASELLFSLRKRHRQLVGNIRKRLEEIVREREVAIFLQDDFITQRNGRWVIPVRMDSKGMVPGVVHDVSRSGETAFMEPIEVIGMVNELENLAAEEKAEQIRILREITGWLREEADPLLACYQALVDLDFHNAIAAFADLLNANQPRLSPEMDIRIDNGCHPLLLLLEKERQGSRVVPMNLAVGKTTGIQSLLITGPNTGGKTIAIKSVGLLLLLAQSGIPIPADASSVLPAVATVAADIGDDQSLEESLSTFSAHIRKISALLATAGPRSIVLLDELGTGTDPAQGGAIACAVLAELQRRGATVLATTHLIDIVAFVQRTAGMSNAAMEFDAATHTPRYRLTVGEPGQSHAFDTARRCGLPEPVLEQAIRLAGKMDSEFHSLLAELKELRQQQESRLAAAAQLEKVAIAREEAATAALREIEQQRREAREKGLVAAKELLNATKAELNSLLESARQGEGKKARQQAAALAERLDQEMAALQPTRELNLDELTVGSRVFVKTLGRDATVLAVDRKLQKLRLSAGSLELEVPLAGVSAPADCQPQPTRPRKAGQPATGDAPYELNLIGCRTDDALERLDKFLDNSLLCGLREVRIIHGVGTGALLRAVREQLGRSPQIKSFRRGESFEGGEGATIAEFKD